MRHQRRAGVISCVALLAILICGVFSPLGVGAAKTNDKIDSLNDKLDQLDDEKKELEENISTAKDQRASEIEKKENLDSEIANLEQQIATINELIVELDGEIATKDEQVAQLETEIDEKYEVLKKRMRSSYEQGPVSVLSVFFSSNDFSTMLTQMDIIGEILNYDNQLITSLEQDKTALSDARTQLVGDREQQQQAKDKLNEREVSLETKLQESEALIERINSDVSSYESEYRAIEDEEAKLEKELKEQLEALNTPSNVYVGGDLIWPLPAQYTTISSKYGYRYHPVLHVNKLHSGNDISAPRGTPIYAINSGTVVTSSYSAAWGNYVVVDHGGGFSSLYAHMTARSVSKGQKVTKGQTLGTVGNTGWSTGNHLHFETRVNGTPVNSMNYYTKA